MHYLTNIESGIGLAIARFLVREGHNVVVSARSKAGLEEFQSQSPKQVRIVVGNMTDYSIGKEIANLALKEFGTIDGVVVNHGTLAPVARISDANIEDWKHNFDVNFFSAIAFVRLLPRGSVKTGLTSIA